MPTFFVATGATHPGLRRPANEDSAYVGERLLLVADGMGGAAYGEVASAVATHAVTYLDRWTSPQGLGHDLPAAVEFAEHRLRRAVERDPRLDGMGTTMTAMLLLDDRIALAHVGDTRAYRLHEGVLEQITRDHTFVQLLVELGELTPAQAATHPQRHVLVKAMRGDGDAVTADVQVRAALPGDRYLLCSDGLSDVVPGEYVRAVLAGHAGPEDAGRELVEAALAAGGPDNVTCVVADVAAGDGPVPRAPRLLGAAAGLDARGYPPLERTQPLPQLG